MNNIINPIMAVVFLAVTSVAQAGLQQGIDAYENGDYQIASGEFEPLAADMRRQCRSTIPAPLQVLMTGHLCQPERIVP